MMKFLNNFLKNNNNTMKSDDTSTVRSEQCASKLPVNETFPDWNKAVTIRYGEPKFEEARDKSGYHQNQGYFSKNTQVAEDRMYRR
jgi:hypothetical protein